MNSSVQWLKNFQIIATDNYKYIGGTVAFPSLRITLIDYEDEGKYICTATNIVGTGRSSEILFRVIRKTLISGKCFYLNDLTF
jgi:hypothetical protein